jgi:micrococcal nuclease
VFAFVLLAACTPGRVDLGQATPTAAIETSAVPTAIPVAGSLDGSPGVPNDAIRAHVTRVVDGDTVVLSGIPVGEIDRRTGGHRARLIGIDTPETHNGTECFGREASAFTERELDGKDVRVAFDVDPLDRYGRALVYVWEVDGTFFNGLLAADGFALQLTVPPNVRYADLFSRLVSQARNANRGFWRSC